MNWARDNANLSEEDLKTVFKYEPKESTVIRMLASQDWRVEISSQESEKQWSQWIENDLPSINGSDSGVVLLLAKRSGEPALQRVKKVTSDDWIERANKESHLVCDLRRADTFSPLQEKEQSNPSSAARQILSGRRGVRTIPFSRDTFWQITSSFHTHGSIARVVSRTDVPVFTCNKVRMTEPAYVYNCRSSNAWEMDLALTATHFPKSRLTFAILFGCPFSIEKEIVMRLARVKAEAAHPLLLPGMFAEFEARRHTTLVEEMGNKLEALIFQLDFQSNNLKGPQRAEAEARSKEKRTAYLDLAYLRNSLVSWNIQLAKMVQHCRQLNRDEYRNVNGNNDLLYPSHSARVGRPAERIETRSVGNSRSPSRDEWFEVEASAECEPLIQDENADLTRTWDCTMPINLNSSICLSKDKCVELGPLGTKNNELVMTERLSQMTGKNQDDIGEDTYSQMRDAGFKIESRLMSIRDENDDKIRDCTMRVEGMAMATQWSHSETNVEVALATNQDSRHMRSIALVTMIFLPGTFFASMFSMTFFNWSNQPGTQTVSTYLWVYVLITISFTALTIGLWYYIVVFRHSRGKRKDRGDLEG
ncbi:uncharacterized protein BDR25DRAFT_250230 [Lindgomyces ingoldianus]|uniref:Uncharacterized protein n=1 Tax=Lindgomyces ingoldianus TaxID=673940 RepID=A0ACB6RF07_9PLEO|nr:uncharacterized protein BDR25DRAFT_250230 [Lindgomyces ingoldianus]KAF2477888.1 hypothetical protein BDR25DRAFT_250230 [Lindgomyces ingoldianus]